MSESPSELVAESFAVDVRGIDVAAGLAGVAATAVPLAAGILVDEPLLGMLAGLGGLQVCLGVPRLDRRRRVLFGLLALIGSTPGVGIASHLVDTVWLAAVVGLLWCSAWAFLRTLGPPGAMDGLVISLTLVVFSGFGLGDTSAPVAMGWVLVGGAAGLVLMVLATWGATGEGVVPGTSFAAVAGNAARMVARAVVHDRVLRVHALRLGVAVGVTTLAYQAFGLDHGYWMTLTIVAILQPTEHDSRVRSLQRTAGTLVSTAVLLVLLLVTSNEAVLVACDALAVFGLFAVGKRSYFWTVAFLTPTILLLISAADFQGFDIAAQRALYTVLGIVIGLGIAELFWRFAPGSWGFSEGADRPSGR
jgi:hypothetical protein